MSPDEKIQLLREALGFVESTLSGHHYNWEHDGDEETGQHDEDCRACEYEALIERSRAALAATEPTPEVSTCDVPGCDIAGCHNPSQEELLAEPTPPTGEAPEWVATVEVSHAMFQPSVGAFVEHYREKYDVVPGARPKPTEAEDDVCYNGNHEGKNGRCVVDGGRKPTEAREKALERIRSRTKFPDTILALRPEYVAKPEPTEGPSICSRHQSPVAGCRLCEPTDAAKPREPVAKCDHPTVSGHCCICNRCEDGAGRTDTKEERE